MQVLLTAEMGSGGQGGLMCMTVLGDLKDALRLEWDSYSCQLNLSMVGGGCSPRFASTGFHRPLSQADMAQVMFRVARHYRLLAGEPFSLLKQESGQKEVMDSLLATFDLEMAIRE